MAAGTFRPVVPDTTTKSLNRDDGPSAVRVGLFILILLVCGSGVFWYSAAAEPEPTVLAVHVGVAEDPPDGTVIQLRTPDRSRVISEWTYQKGDEEAVFHAILPSGRSTLQSRPILAMTPAGPVVHPEPYNQDLDAGRCEGTITVDVVLTHGKARIEGDPNCHLGTTDTTPSQDAPQEPMGSPGPAPPYGMMILSAAGLVGLWGAWRSSRRWLPLLPLWARRTPSRDGESVRERILDVVRQNPGIPRESLRMELGFAEGRLQHHLKVLFEEGRIAEVRRARMRCFFIPGTHTPEQAVRLAVLARPGARKVHEAVLRTPGASMSEIAEATELSPSRVSRLIARLEDDGLLLTRWSGGRKRHYPCDL